MTLRFYPAYTSENHHNRRELTPETIVAFEALNGAAFADGRLSTKMKQIVAVAHVS